MKNSDGGSPPRRGAASRRLEQALDYVGRQWFPLNPKVTEEIQHKLTTNSYGSNHNALLNDLKGDFALYTFCLKKLKEKSSAAYGGPLEYLFQTSFDDLKNIIDSARGELSKHDISSAEKGQALRLKFTVLSCSAAELLAKSKKANSDLAFTCALSRQLGLNLIAWNYPSIYMRAMSLSRTANESIDEILAESLGFNPSSLADELIIPASTSSVIRKAAGLNVLAPGDIKPREPQLSGQHADPSLIDICEISDAFAQLNDPEHYPNISRRYETVITQIDQHLGPGGSANIMDLVQNKFNRYIACVPEVFRSDTPIETSMAKVSTDFTNALFEKNVYAQRCPDRIKKEIREVYRHVSREQVSSMGIGYLVNKVIPIAGFGLGCVYLLDGKRVMLVPKLRIGACQIDRYKAINCALVDPEGSLIVEALYCSMPIKQEGVVLHNDVVSPILGPIGTKEPMGVLYLEMSDTLRNQHGQEPLVLFKAIRDCFNDCLNV